MPFADPDDALVVQAGKGDSAAFDRIMDRYRRCVYAYALSLARDRALAEDVTQEVFLRTWEAIGRVADGSALLGWLYATTRHCASELARRDRKALHAPPRLSDGAGLDECQMRLLEVLGTLPDDMRAVISLKYTEGLSCEAIGKRLNRPLGSVTSLLSRAYHELRERLKRSGHEMR